MENKNIFLPNYSIGKDVYKEIPQITKLYGKKIVFIGGKTALSKAAHLVEEVLKDTDIRILGTFWYGGDATYENVENLKKEKAILDADIIFAFGGGKALDTCKNLAWELKKSIFNFPTIASTCASVSTVCVMYDKNGVFRDLYWRDRPADHSFINLNIVAEAPDKYIWAGIGDTLAKAYEPEFSARGRDLDFVNSIGITLSKLCQEPLVKYGLKGFTDAKKNTVSNELQEIVAAIIINTGLVSNHLIDNYNTCVAHALCYGFSTIEKVEHNHLHGEIVSYGLLVQLMLDNDLEELNKLLNFYKKINLPTSYKCFDIERKDLDGVFEKAILVNDTKVAAVEITKEKLEKAVDDLEEYIRN